jgi:hypothetical protein
MRLTRLADLFLAKYKFAVSVTDAESILRHEISLLWNIPNKTYNVLKACADADASKPKNANEQKAVVGHKFCKQLVSLIDYLKANSSDISLGEMREVLLNIVNLITENVSVKFNENGRPSEKGESSNVQFGHVSELIFQLTPVSKKHQIKLRNELYSKARNGLFRILSLSNTMLDEIKQLEVMAPEKFTHETFTDVDINQENPTRFTPQRAPLSNYDIIDFIRQHGDEYGISGINDWELAFRNDPQLKEEMTTVINALNRGHVPRDNTSIKQQIAQILQQHKDRKVA